MFSFPAKELRKYCGVPPSHEEGEFSAQDNLGPDRRHDWNRSCDIREFVLKGFPATDKARSRPIKYSNSRMPGLLPTAVIINILTIGDKRNGCIVRPEHLITLRQQRGNMTEIAFPSVPLEWTPKDVPPIQVIDGQHRLWAFQDFDVQGHYEIPVIAFVGLDLCVQAYLYYVINVLPKKINSKLALNMYPLLQTKEWLSSEIRQYDRSIKAKIVVNIINSHAESPWLDRVNMRGVTGLRGIMATESSWMNSILSSQFTALKKKKRYRGDVYHSDLRSSGRGWGLADQAALLIIFGQELRKEINNGRSDWIVAFRSMEPSQDIDHRPDMAFEGPKNLLNYEKGLRVMYQVLTKYFNELSETLQINVLVDLSVTDVSDEYVTNRIEVYRSNDYVLHLLSSLAKELSTFDWRTANFPALSQSQIKKKRRYVGNRGYRTLLYDVLVHLSDKSRVEELIAATASKILKRMERRL